MLKSQMNKILIPLWVTVFLLLGCSSKTNKHTSQTNILQEQALTNTQKTTLRDESEVTIFFLTTHISGIDHYLIETDKIEKFIVSAYIPTQRSEIKYEDIFFKINKKEPISIRELQNDDELLRLLPVSNPWGRYYLVKAPVDDSTKGVFFEMGIIDIGSSKIEFHDRYGSLPMGETFKFKTNFTD